MPRQPPVSVRITPDERASWTLAAKERGQTLNAFVVAAVRASLAPAPKQPTRLCARYRYHRPGVFCRECDRIT